MRTRPFVVLALLMLSACARSKPIVAPVVDVQARLDSADELIRIGCFDCLSDALRTYNAIRVTANVPAASAEAALIGSVRAALLLDLRERELGTSDGGNLQRARAALAGRDDLTQTFAPLIADVEMTTWRYSRLDLGPEDPALRRRFQQL